MGTSVRTRGFSLVEIIVAAAVILAFISATAGALHAYVRLMSADAKRTQAALLTEETSEALQLLRDLSWEEEIAPLALETPYYLAWDGARYQATTTQVVQGAFVRTFSFSAVRRDGADNISASGATDTDTRRVSVSIRTTDAEAPVFSGEFFIHNVHDN